MENTNKPEIVFDDFLKIDLRIGEVLSAEKVEKSKKLIKMQVSFGSFERQIVAGIGAPGPNGITLTPESLIGTRCLFVVNLPPRVLAGVESHGMILAASGEEGISLMIPQRIDVPAGTFLS